MNQHRSSVSIVDVVLGAHRPGPRRSAVSAASAGAAACALLGLWALRSGRWPEPGPEPIARVPVEISLDEEPRRLDAPARSPSVRTERATSSPSPSPRRSLEAHPPRRSQAPPAQAAPIVARAPSAPVDLTGETFVAGDASVFGGGVTSTQPGTSTIPGPPGGASARQPAAGGAGGRNGGAPVGLASQSWSCPWPSEAEPLPIDEETAIVRVVVRPDGSAESVAVVSDPGHGFGQAAASCAMRTRFTPGRAAHGAPVRAISSPIRVRFTR